MATHTVAVIAPHPDDEAIFAGGTIARLVASGHRVVVVAATTGDAGVGDPAHLARIRARELEAAASVLGVSAVHHLGFADSGLGPQVPGYGFAAVDPVLGADRLAEVLAAESVTDVVCDPAGGIYPHPDHRHAHDVTVRAVSLAEVAAVHAVTVDREHLHFVETHLVAGAHGALADSAPGAPAGFGAATVEIDVAVHLDDTAITLKRAAMAAHASQLPPGSAVMKLDEAAFASVYGTEWFCRLGAPGVIDTLG
jgi:LmbE family N-acetylglucosaminyl deacetylase